MSRDTSEENSAKPVRLRPRAPCPICAKLSARRYHPFCSLACADIDLSRWLSGRYAIPAAERSEDDEAEASRPSDATDAEP